MGVSSTESGCKMFRKWINSQESEYINRKETYIVQEVVIVTHTGSSYYTVQEISGSCIRWWCC